MKGGGHYQILVHLWATADKRTSVVHLSNSPFNVVSAESSTSYSEQGHTDERRDDMDFSHSSIRFCALIMVWSLRIWQSSQCLNCEILKSMIIYVSSGEREGVPQGHEVRLPSRCGRSPRGPGSGTSLDAVAAAIQILELELRTKLDRNLLVVMVGTRVVIRIAVGTVLEILEVGVALGEDEGEVDNEAGDSGGYRGRGRGGRGQYGGRGRGRDNGWRNGDGPKWDGGDNWNATNPPSNQPWSSSGGTKSYGQNQPSTWNNSEDNKPSVGEQGDPWASKVSSTEGKGQQNDSWSSKMTSCGAEDTRGGWDSKALA
ncbi:hypothetical protein ZEAMMB73_Zm00001d000370 [Zea mays]|nr:hypothetical protein ZEAMMB73_Zm00001d000370 [Zea mays]